MSLSEFLFQTVTYFVSLTLTFVHIVTQCFFTFAVASLTWLAQNLDNPFRGWDGAEHIPAAAAKKAANQSRKTRSLLMKLATEPGEDAPAQAMDAVTAYTQTFNKMGFIETEERDEIYMALRLSLIHIFPRSGISKRKQNSIRNIYRLAI